MDRASPRPIARWTAAFALAGTVLVAGCSESGSEEPPKTPVASTASGAYLAGRHAARIKDSRAASDYFGQALSHQPANNRVLLRAFNAHVRSGRVAEASELAKKILSIDPDNAVANLVLIADAARREDYDEVNQRLEKLSNSSGVRLAQPVIAAWTTFGKTKDGAEAIKALGPLRLEPQFVNFYLVHSALIDDLAGNTASAVERYAELAKRQSLPSLRVVHLIASFQSRNDKKAEAEKTIEDFLDINSDSATGEALLKKLRDDGKLDPVVPDARAGIAELFMNLSSAFQSSGRSDQALFFVRLADHIRPGDPTTIYLLGTVLEDDDQHAAAVATFERVPRDSIFSWAARKSIATNLIGLDRDADAIKALDVLAKERPDRWDAVALLGNLYRARSRFAEAVTAYDKAIERIKAPQKRHWNLYYVRGIALERSKQWPRAEADFLQALTLSPDQAYVLNYLAYSWIERGEKLGEAKEMLAKALRQRPNDGYIVDSVGWVDYRLGNFKDAVVHLERATELRPHDPTINDHLGDAYWRAGRKHEARVQWRRALSLKPEKDAIPAIQKKLADGMEPFKPIKAAPPTDPKK
ncbi:MAG: tetratricopeptide repeat protein [Bauldia litoralis]